jgi:hypothetical protein
MGTLYVLKHTAALTNQNQETPLAGLVFFKLFAVLGKLVNPLGEQRNLNLGRAGVLFVLSEFSHNGSRVFFA